MLQQKIDEALLAEQEARKDRVRSGKWKPSMLGRCYRAHYWARQSEPESNPVDTRTLRVFAAGKLFHNFVQGFLPNTQVEVKVEDDNIMGYADVVGDETVYDIKSQHSKAFWYSKKAGYDVKKEKFTNWLQVMLYAKMLGKKFGCLMFVSKDDLCIDEYVEALSDWEGEVDKELKALNDFWVAGVLPEAKPRAYNGKECTYCSYLDKCNEYEAARLVVSEETKQ
jgi:hypothetical protein